MLHLRYPCYAPERGFLYETSGGNCVWCLVIVVIRMEFGREKRWGHFKAIIWGRQHNPVGNGCFYEEGGCHYVMLLYWNFIVSFTGYWKRFYRITLLTILLLFYLLYIYWNWQQGQKYNLKYPKVTSMILTMNYSVSTIISTCTHPCDINTHSLTRMHLLQLKTHNIWMEYFWNQKVFLLGIKEISTLNSYIIYI